MGIRDAEALIERYAPGFNQQGGYLAVWRGDGSPGSVRLCRHNNRVYYRDFATGDGGDMVDWLRDWAGLSFPEAKAVIAGVADIQAGLVYRPTPKRPITPGKLPPWVKALHIRSVNEMNETGLPPPALNRGWTAQAAAALQVGRDGPDLLYPILDPNGELKALKRRYSVPRRGFRFRWEGGLPKLTDTTSWWRIPEGMRKVVICEGEGKGVSLALALGQAGFDARLGVCSVSGTNGRGSFEMGTPRLHQLERAYILPDPPVWVRRRGYEADVSVEAALRWQAQLEQQGLRTAILPTLGDACDVAHAQGLQGLAAAVYERMRKG